MRIRSLARDRIKEREKDGPGQTDALRAELRSRTDKKHESELVRRKAGVRQQVAWRERTNARNEQRTRTMISVGRDETGASGLRRHLKAWMDARMDSSKDLISASMTFRRYFPGLDPTSNQEV